MSAPDRKLVDLIVELTDCGVVSPLSDVLEHWGPDCATRVIGDGFAVIRHSGDAWRGDTGLDDDRFLPLEEALVRIHDLQKTDQHLILAGPWGAVHQEDEPELILRYSADDPAAIAEVRARHAARREEWERMRVQR